MTGRDIVKTILYNNLLDKDCTADSDSIRFCEFLPDDTTLEYCMTESEYLIQHVQFIDGGEIRETLDSGSIDNVSLVNISRLDSIGQMNPVLEPYSQYSMTFYMWIKSIGHASIFDPLLEYIASDPNFSRNCRTFNQMMSYLEANEVDVNLLSIAKLAWVQYVRECRILE